MALPTAERAAACSRAELPALREAELLEEAERSREEAATFARSVDSTGRATRLEELREEDDVPREAVPVEVRRLSWPEVVTAGEVAVAPLFRVLAEDELRAEEELREEEDVPREAVPVEVRRLSWLEAEVAGAEEREELPEVLRPTEEDPRLLEEDVLRPTEEDPRLLEEDVLRLTEEEPRLLEEDELREDEAEDPLLRVVEVLREPEELLDCA